MIPGLSDRYRVVSTVGTGGMGIVYKAIDTSLNRPVAIKAIRPGGLDEHAARRLRAEALAAASLDHPYICKVYELIETPTDTLIVMEFVEGETLADKLERGVPPLDATLLVGSEITEGLAAAHARGVVHRDIKPSNVMITPHGHVKLLDFGLAHDVSPGESTRTTQTGVHSRTGSPAYMSPEQARGLDIQPASDLFSLGVVLYECLAGRLPFEGRTGFEYVGNLLSQKPAPLGPLAPGAPFELVQLVERCLEKDPAWRPESADAVSRELRMLLERGARGAAATSITRWSSARVRARTAAALGALALVAAGVFAANSFWRDDDFLNARREMVPVVTWDTNEEDSKVSPDGRWVSFVSDRAGRPALFAQSLDGGEARDIVLEGDVLGHVWSPDGRRIAALTSHATGCFLQVVPAFFGGAVEHSVPLSCGTPRATTARPVRWIDDDVFIVAEPRLLGQPGGGAAGRILARVSLASRTIEDATPRNLHPAMVYQWFDVHPATRMLVMTGIVDQEEDLWVADADGSRGRRLTNDDYFDRFPVWTGPVVTFQSNRGGQIDLWQIDPASGGTRLVSSSESEERPESTSADGAFVTLQQHNANARLWRLDARGGVDRVTNDALSDFAPSASSDGRTMVFQRHAGSPSLGMTLLDSQLVVAREANGRFAQASPVAPAGFFPKLSPSGTAVAYFGRTSSASRFATLFVKDLSTGHVRTLSSQCPLPGFLMAPVEWSQHNMAWSADGALYFVEQSEAGAVIRRFDTSAAAPVNITSVLPARVVDLLPSPDGRELAYLAMKDGVVRLQRRDLRTGVEKTAAVWQLRPTDVGLRGWRPDGALLVVLRERLDATPESLVMEALLVDARGTRRVARLDGAEAFSARLAPAGDVLYYTGFTDGVNNIFALDLASGRARQLTANDARSASYSGLEPLADGSLIYSQNDRRRDIWLSRTAADRSGR